MTYEEYLAEAIKSYNEKGNNNYTPLKDGDRLIIEELENKGLIKNVRYIGREAVGFDLTYSGTHYFD